MLPQTTFVKVTAYFVIKIGPPYMEIIWAYDDMAWNEIPQDWVDNQVVMWSETTRSALWLDFSRIGWN